MAGLRRNYVLRTGRADILERIKRQLDECYQEQGEFDVAIKPHVGGVSNAQRGYYRGVVLPAIAGNADGYTRPEIHELMLVKFAPRRVIRDTDGQELETLIRTGRMNKKQFTDWLSEVIRWAEDLAIYIPPPRREGMDYWTDWAA